MFEQHRSQQDLIAAALETYLDTVPDGVTDRNEKGEPDQDPNGSPRGPG